MAVTIYSTPTCPYCKLAKEFFTEHNVEYQDIDVAADQDEARVMVEKSGQMGVPVIIVPADRSSSQQEELVVGFDREKLSQLLSISQL